MAVCRVLATEDIESRGDREASDLGLGLRASADGVRGRVQAPGSAVSFSELGEGNSCPPQLGLERSCDGCGHGDGGKGSVGVAFFEVVSVDGHGVGDVGEAEYVAVAGGGVGVQGCAARISTKYRGWAGDVSCPAEVMLMTRPAPLACSCSATRTAKEAPTAQPTTPISVGGCELWLEGALVTHMSVW